MSGIFVCKSAVLVHVYIAKIGRTRRHGIAVGYLGTAVGYLGTAVGYLGTAVGYLGTAVG